MSANETTRRSDKSATDDEPNEKVQKRAQWESFAFSVIEPGTVRVENHSYGADEVDEHTYRVEIKHGSAVACTCPADEHHPGPCKHRTAVEANAPVLAAASGVVATDGGQLAPNVAEAVTDEEIDARAERAAVEETDERPEECTCAPTTVGEPLPCFECYMAGFDTPADVDTGDRK